MRTRYDQIVQLLDGDSLNESTDDGKLGSIEDNLPAFSPQDQLKFLDIDQVKSIHPRRKSVDLSTLSI